jgi:GDP-L-fucose synthase
MYHSVMPTNLYGPGDKYDSAQAHVIPCLIHRFTEAKRAGQDSVTIWGTGRPLREFLHVDDLATAVLHVASLDNPPDWVNAGSGEEISILQLAQLVAEVVGYSGEIRTDPSRPDGTPRKLADSSLLRSTGWQPQITLRDGLRQTYEAFLSEREQGLVRSA